MPTLREDLQTAVVAKVIAAFAVIGVIAFSVGWSYIKHSPEVRLAAAAGGIGAIVGAVVTFLAFKIRGRHTSEPVGPPTLTPPRESTDPRVTLDRHVSIGQEFWIPHGARESYRVNFPVVFADPPAFENVPWPVPLSTVPQTTGKPDREGFTLVTGDGRSEGDGSGKIRLTYRVKGRLEAVATSDANVTATSSSDPQLSFRKNSYWQGDDGPFCSRCWDSERKLVRLLIRRGFQPVCPACHITAEDPDRPPPKPVARHRPVWLRRR
jgi:hypothetical protein